jgi:hypothetical protein
MNMPVERFDQKKSHFMLSLDYTYVMASDGNLKVVADASRKK